MTAQSIGAAKGGGYARYLESKTVAPEPGAYYLTPEGEPTQPRGRWHGAPASLSRLGIEGREVEGDEFRALMEGRHPHGGWVRKAGADGERGGGIDLTFSAPKSVSVEWALGSDATRERIEDAHSRAVVETFRYIRENVPTVRRRVDGAVIEEPAKDLIAAEYRHTTARGVVPGDLPDPQLHSHVVLTTAIRHDERVVAVASRPLFRSARATGAYYRSALAHNLRGLGYEIEAGTGRDGRYFELAGRPRELLEAFSTRSREVTAAAERFRAKWGRAPEGGELRQVKQENRRRKTLVNRGDLDRAWQQTAAQHGQGIAPRQACRGQDTIDRVETKLTKYAATFARRDLDAVALEQTVGDLAPADALKLRDRLIQEQRVIELDDGAFTTRSIRDKELRLERQFTNLAKSRRGDPDERHRQRAARAVAERVGHKLSDEQLQALTLITGGGGAGVLIGPAGTGKGVVIDAAARAEQQAGNRTIGTAVSGSTAQRLGHDCPSLEGSTLTLDALLQRALHGRLQLDTHTVIYLDEAGMADTSRLGAITDLAATAGAKLVLIGDSAQLPSIGAGGMLPRLADRAPRAELTHVHRTRDPAERRAWRDLRHGRTDRAMAHYRSRGRLHIAPTRDDAAERAVTTWARLARSHGVENVALLSDASNIEIDRLNARAQQLRLQQGQLGRAEVPVPGTHYDLRVGDRVATIEQQHPPGAERIENGSRGTILNVDPDADQVLVRLDGTGRQEQFAGDELGKLRLAYAQHIYRAQGATFDRALVLTGGWQTSLESTYVHASRARHGTDWYVNREELGEQGHDTERIARLATRMRNSRAQTPSLLRGAPRRARRADRDRKRALPRLARFLRPRAEGELTRSR